MGRLAIRKVIYSGDKYYFESPELNDGIVILEGKNGHGKTTFIDLMYYGLGGRVNGFNKTDKDSDSKHRQIYDDTNNYIEIHIQIDDKRYELTRNIGDNQIFIVGPDKNVLDYNINRTPNSEEDIFSDWIIKKLGIEVFDIVHGTDKSKLNFSDLMRLIYYDQKTEVDRIFKNPDIGNYYTDSLEIRKAIFEVLIGEIYDDYYSLLGQFKLKSKEFEQNEAIMRSYNAFLNEILEEELSNVTYINSLLEEKRKMLDRIELERNIARNEKSNASKIFEEIDQQKRLLFSIQKEKKDIINAQEAVNQSIEKILYLMDETNEEIDQIEKIRFVNKKLKLFSPNTCPYCLREVERQNGRCICGKEIDEEQYEKFFYTDIEYIEIIKVKQKSIKTLTDLLNKKKERKSVIKEKELKLNEKTQHIQNYIEDLAKDISAEYNSAYIKNIDDRIRKINEEIIKLEQARELAQKKESLVNKLATLRNEVESLKAQVNKYYTNAQIDMAEKKKIFNEIYLPLMKSADQFCYDAYLTDDYMPCINLNEYRESSASVSKRLMYFLTLLIMSVKYNINYPRFLMIDTPDKEGIDQDNLIKNIGELSRVYEPEKNNKSFQIILTTGINTYPTKFKKYVFLKLEGGNKLLKEKEVNEKLSISNDANE